MLIQLLSFSILPSKNFDLSLLSVTDPTCSTRAYIAVGSTLLMSKSVMVSCNYQSDALRPIVNLLKLSNASR